MSLPFPSLELSELLSLLSEGGGSLGASWCLGTRPPVDLRAVRRVRAICQNSFILNIRTIYVPKLKDRVLQLDGHITSNYNNFKEES